MGIYTSQCNTLGGIIKFKSKCIEKINGFPNDFWGWGIEDKALQNRSEFFNINKKTNLTNKEKHPQFFKIFNDINDRKKDTKNSVNHWNDEYKNFNKKSNDEKEKHVMHSGLNTRIQLLKKRVA